MNDSTTKSDDNFSVPSSKTTVQLAKEDILILKKRFNKKKKIFLYCIAIILVIGTAISSFAIISEYLKYEYVDKIWEMLIPFFAGISLALFLLLGLVALIQENNIELKNGQKTIFKGIVTKRKEEIRRTMVGGKSENNYYYYIYLNDICFEHHDIYFEINEGDFIEIHLSEKLNLVLFKNIVKNKAIAEVIPETKEKFGIFDEVPHKHEVIKRSEYLTDDELSALIAQKHKRLKTIIPAAIILLIAFGTTAEIILWADSFYSLDEIIALRIGFWGVPLVFFLLLSYRKFVPLSNDIHKSEKIIICERLINKEETYRTAYHSYSYSIKGLEENLEVSKEIFDVLNPGIDFEVHRTSVRKKFLKLKIPSTGKYYNNPKIFK